MKNVLRFRSALLLALALSAAPMQGADDGDHKVKNTAKSGLRTGGHAARDGAKTAGRTIKGFFTGGVDGAKREAKAGAAETKKNAKRNAADTKAAAKGK